MRNELADKIEAAEGPSRELDAEIDRLFHSRPKNGDFDAAEQAIWQVEKAWSGLLVRSDGFARGSFCVPAYTASLDAALSLVPEGRSYILHSADSRYHDHEQGARPSAIVFSKSWSRHEASAATPALALVAAALRAGNTKNRGFSMPQDEPDGRCPACGEDEMDGARCYYCGFHDYACGEPDCKWCAGDTDAG